MTLLGPDRTPLRSDDYSGDGTSIDNFVILEEGSYLIVPGGDSDAGAYTLSLTEITPQNIDFDEPVSADLADSTVWTFAGQAGQIVSITMAEDGSDFEANLVLLSADGTPLRSDDYSPAGARINNFVLPQEGTYLIVPGGYSDAGAYTLSLTEITPQNINFDQPVSAGLEDSTVWTFEGKAGQIVSIAMAEDNSGLDTIVTLRGPAGEFIAENDDDGVSTNSLIPSAILPVDGSYTIVPGGYSSSGEYTLSLTEAIPSEITVGVEVIADIADGTVWTFEGQADQVVTIEMNEAGSGIDTYLTLLGPDGQILIENDDFGDSFNSRIDQFVLPEDGRYMIIASALGSDSGAYSLTLIDEAEQ